VKEILVLTPAESRFGFALAGVRQGELVAENAWAALREATADPMIGVIAVDERLLTSIDPLRLRELTARWGGVLVTLPGPAGATPPAEDELQRLVRRALGYHVRLEP
jgi:V/A-type H+-transporting ATPase subunit F